jgi:hypothetical protein
MDGPANEVGYLSWDEESVENGDHDRRENPHFDYAAQIRRDPTKLAPPLLSNSK